MRMLVAVVHQCARFKVLASAVHNSGRTTEEFKNRDDLE